MKCGTVNTVLRALFNGLEINLPGESAPLVLGYDEKDRPCVCYKMHKYAGKEPAEEVLVVAEITLNGFFRLCEKMPDASVAALAGSIALKRSMAQKPK